MRLGEVYIGVGFMGTHATRMSPMGGVSPEIDVGSYYWGHSPVKPGLTGTGVPCVP